MTPDAGTPAGERAAAISLAGVTSAALFEASFEVLAVLADGAADVRVVANGSGIAPGSLANGAAGVGIALPEPGLALLLAGSLFALGAKRR